MWSSAVYVAAGEPYILEGSTFDHVAEQAKPGVVGPFADLREAVEAMKRRKDNQGTPPTNGVTP